jgi:hypothetical protein
VEVHRVGHVPGDRLGDLAGGDLPARVVVGKVTFGEGWHVFAVEGDRVTLLSSNVINGKRVAAGPPARAEEGRSKAGLRTVDCERARGS